MRLKKFFPLFFEGRIHEPRRVKMLSPKRLGAQPPKTVAHGLSDATVFPLRIGCGARPLRLSSKSSEALTRYFQGSLP